MAMLGEALLEALGGDVGPGLYVSPQSAAHGLVRAAGSVSAAAREAGVARSTFRRWLAGSTPRGGGDWLVEVGRDAWRQSQMTPQRRAELTQGWVMHVAGSYAYSSGGYAQGAEDRLVPLSDYLPDGVMDQLIDAYLDGADADELHEIVASQINDPAGWYASTFALDNPQGQWDVQRVDL